MKALLSALVLGLSGVLTAAPRETVVFVSAHQDDIISSVGTMLLMRDRFDLHVVDYTDGGFGRDQARIERRRQEEAQVCAALRATPHEIGEHDGDAYAPRESVQKLDALLRELRPRAVFLHWPLDVHSDHLMSAAAALKAIRRLEDPELEVYFFQYAINSKGFPATHYVDISAVAKEKERIIRLYASMNPSDAMCREEMVTSRRLACNLWPPKYGEGSYAEAFCPLVGRPQGHRCVFTELARDPAPAKFPRWGR